MEWTTVIAAVLSSGLIIGVIEIARDWRAKKAAASSANKESEYEAQSKGLDLVQEFYEKVSGVLKSNSQEVIDRLGDIDRRLGDIEGYLNGGFAEWKQNKKKTPKTAKK